jgi:Toastrack DUF4097
LMTLAVLSVPARAAEEVIDRLYPLASNGRLQLQNTNGSVSIAGWDRSLVEVCAIKRTMGDPRNLFRVRILVDDARDHLSIKTRDPQDEGGEVSVEYQIRVPRQVQLHQISTVNGTVRVSGMQASGSLRSVNGDIEVLRSEGGFHAHTINGNLRLELSRLEPAGPFDAGTVNGSIFLALPADANASLDVRTLNGRFRSALPVYVQSSSQLNRFQGRIGLGGASIALHTVNGAIRIMGLKPDGSRGAASGEPPLTPDDLLRRNQ